MSSLQSSLAIGQVAQAFNQLKLQVSNGKKILTEGRPAILVGPAQSPALSPEQITEILGEDAPKFLAACNAFEAELAK